MFVPAMLPKPLPPRAHWSLDHLQRRWQRGKQCVERVLTCAHTHLLTHARTHTPAGPVHSHATCHGLHATVTVPTSPLSQSRPHRCVPSAPPWIRPQPRHLPPWPCRPRPRHACVWTSRHRRALVLCRPHRWPLNFPCPMQRHWPRRCLCPSRNTWPPVLTAAPPSARPPAMPPPLPLDHRPPPVPVMPPPPCHAATTLSCRRHRHLLPPPTFLPPPTRPRPDRRIPA